MLNSYNMRQWYVFAILMSLSLGVGAEDKKLTGKVIGTKETVDYSTFTQSTTANTREMAFDGNLNTCFASWERSYTWTGLDLGSKHVITQVGWSPRNDSQGEQRVVLGLFEGANREDFLDALPLHIIRERGTIGKMSYAPTDCSAGFRYVRYVGPSDARCNIAELEFFGHPGEGDDTHLSQLTNLPTVSIHTINGEIPYDKENDIAAKITIISDGKAIQLSEPGAIRERGNYSRTFPKKPYRIKFDVKQRVLDAPAKAKKWTLINNYGDKTLMRNLLAFELSRRLGMPYTPYGHAVDVVLNGEYKGCYQLCDQIDVDKHRVNITEMTPEDKSGQALTGGYFFEIDAYADQERWMFWSSRGNPVSIKSPDDDEITYEQFNYIRSHFNLMESNWKNYLDLNTFLRHFLVGELSGNTDTYWSVFMYKQRDDKTVYTGPVWDFDLAFDNDNRTYPVNNKSDYIYRSGGSCAGNMRSFVDRIVVSDATARAQMLDIWDEARQGGLTKENLEACINQLEAELEESQHLNFLRWPIINSRVHQNPRIWGSFQKEVENVRRFLLARMDWMDRKLGYTYIPSAIEDIADEGIAIDHGKPYRVYSLSGRYCGSSISGLGRGIYIVRQKGRSFKVAL